MLFPSLLTIHLSILFGQLISWQQNFALGALRSSSSLTTGSRGPNDDNVGGMFDNAHLRPDPIEETLINEFEHRIRAQKGFEKLQHEKQHRDFGYGNYGDNEEQGFDQQEQQQIERFNEGPPFGDDYYYQNKDGSSRMDPNKELTHEAEIPLNIAGNALDQLNRHNNYNAGHETAGRVADDNTSPKVVTPVISAERKGQAEQPFPPPIPASAVLQHLPKPEALVQIAPAEHIEESKRVSVAQDKQDIGDNIFIAVTTVCSAAAVFGVVGASVFWYKQHRRYKSAEGAEYGPNYGVTGPTKGRKGPQPGDDKLASSAHLYHYQHTKQNIVAMEQADIDGKGQESDDSEGEGEEADYSVYECPGLAPTGDLEVSNPLFETSPTSNSPPATGFMALKDEHSTPSEE